MKIRLLRTARITLNAGEIVEVSPVEAVNMVRIGSAVPVAETAVPVPTEAVEKRTRARKPRKTETD